MKQKGNPGLSFGGITGMMFELWPHFSSRRRTQFIMAFGLMLVSACLEVVSLGAVIPFIAVLTVPENVFNYPVIADNISLFGISTADELVLPLTIIFSVLAVMAGTVRLLVLYFNTRLAFNSGAELSSNIYNRTLYQPYNVHIASNSSEVISAIVNKTGAVIHGILYPLLLLISSLVILIAILITLVVVDPLIAMSVMTGFGVIYGVIIWSVRRQLHRNGQTIAKEQTYVVKALQEGLGGIRDVLLDGSQPVYSNIFNTANRPLQHAMGKNIFLVSSPRFALESIGIVVIAVIAYALSQKTEGLVSALPALAALTFAAQRLLPTMQQSYAAWTTIIGSTESLVDVLGLLGRSIDKELIDTESAAIPFEKEVSFENVSFRYSDENPWIIEDINFVIPKGARVAIVGSTGSGKSTILDLFMGLLEPDRGRILVDGVDLLKNKKSWQKILSHVPQDVYLADATIAENIALGVPKELIDKNKVETVAARAQISSFILERLGGYDAIVGEKGKQLSGGQRQRIGIARSLYKDADILVFDEATSALDNVTEQSVMKALDNLNKNLTILIVAHRLSTIEKCDIILELEKGKIIAQGDYQKLLESSPSFKRMANIVNG
jgi:ATP-binding cassette, subfamily B, bacterial PglK